MGTKGIRRYVGRLPGTGTSVSSSARCIVYDHIRQGVYLCTDNPQLATDVANAQRMLDKGADYRTYELTGDAWCEFGVKLPRRSARVTNRPPLFFVWLCNPWLPATCSFLL